MPNLAGSLRAPLPFYRLLDAYALGQTVEGDSNDAVVAGDIALAKGEYLQAAQSYQSLHQMTDDTSCKLGFALLSSGGSDSEARQHLIYDYCNASSNGTAVLAFAGSYKEKAKTLKRAMLMPNPGAYPRIVYLRSVAIWNDPEFALELAGNTAVEFERPYLLAIRARLLQSKEMLKGEELQHLLSFGAEYPDCAEAALHISGTTGNVQVGMQAIDLLLGNQLQFAPVNQCWYFSFLAARSANDYRTKYTAGKKQVISYMLKRLRTTGESAQAANWDNRNFSRIKTLPRTLFAAALHDIFTSWGEAAFNQKIRGLLH